MKRKQTELDVDFIGGSGTLTKKEEEAISAFIKAGREKRSKTRTSDRKERPRKRKRQYV
jgi:hypothetical protein